jgi:hypothetical protein
VNIIKDIAAVNPAFIIAAVILTYILVYFLRYNAGYVLMLMWSIAALSLMLTPTGKQTLGQAQRQPAIYDKANCLVSATLEGNLWGKSKTVQACRYTGRGIGPMGSGSSGDAAIKSSGRVLTGRYGGSVK